MGGCHIHLSVSQPFKILLQRCIRAPCPSSPALYWLIGLSLNDQHPDLSNDSQCNDMRIIGLKLSNQFALLLEDLLLWNQFKPSGSIHFLVIQSTVLPLALKFLGVRIRDLSIFLGQPFANGFHIFVGSVVKIAETVGVQNNAHFLFLEAHKPVCFEKKEISEMGRNTHHVSHLVKSDVMHFDDVFLGFQVY